MEKLSHENYFDFNIFIFPALSSSRFLAFSSWPWSGCLLTWREQEEQIRVSLLVLLLQLLSSSRSHRHHRQKQTRCLQAQSWPALVFYILPDCCSAIAACQTPKTPQV